MAGALCIVAALTSLLLKPRGNGTGQRFNGARLRPFVGLRLLLTCPPGIEDIVELELRDLFGPISVTPKPHGVQGRVLAEVPDDGLRKVLAMRSIHHVIRHVASFEVGPAKSSLDVIYREIEGLDLSPYLPPEATFRVTTERIGVHEFTSIDVQRAAGQAIVDRYGNKVDLKNYDVEVRVDVVENWCLVGISVTRESLHKRKYRVFEHPAALRPTIAYAMVRLAEPKPGNVFVDPMAGGGTILIEAAHFMGDRLKLYGFDINGRFVEGARVNAEAAGVAHLITFARGDCRRLSELVSGVDRVVTNPPYGVRMEPRGGVRRLYRAFAREAYKAMEPGGRLVAITLKSGTMRKALLDGGFSVAHERSVLHGDIRARVFVAEK